MNEEIKIEETDLKHLSEAMIEAKESFKNYFLERGMDSAFFDLKLEGTVLDSNFDKWKKITMERIELENDEFEEDIIV